jgi:preprotein translocase subunit SecD
LTRRNLIWLVSLAIIFILSVMVVVPLDKGLLFSRGISYGLDLKGGVQLIYQADLSSVEPDQRAEVMQSAAAILSNRVNPLGVSEPVIELYGEDKISIQLAGVQLTEEQKERLGRTALLEFGEPAASDEEARWENELGRWKPATAVINGVEKELTSSYFKENTRVGIDQTTGQVYLYFEWNDEGAKISEEVTKRLLGKRLGIFDGDDALRGEDGLPIAPVVTEVIRDSGQITGLSLNEATELSRQLNAGRLPVPLEIVYESTVSPTLGESFINLALKAGVVALALIIIFVLFYYRVSGVVTSLALVFYLFLTLAIFKLVPVTLTLPGIGGFILSLGMAVDANVLIGERTKEELNSGRTLGSSIEAGFSRAWPAIRDSNITTFIVCAVLYWAGGSIAGGATIKGFAMTLFIGVAVSMFTAMLVSRSIFRLFELSPLSKKPSLFTPYLKEKND